MVVATPVQSEPPRARPAQPRVLRGLVIHDRSGPRRHRFTAKTLQVQLPLRSLFVRGETGGWAWGLNRRALLSILDRDHGDGRPLLTWVEDQLKRAGITEATGEIWLHALPRSLGYAFKPVSFWFCENPAGETVAIVAEVNNTFGDRHVYVIDCRGGYQNGQTLCCDKAFYVSPFCEVNGQYAFRFFRSAVDHGASLARIEYIAADGMRLVTSISGQTQPLTQALACRLWLQRPWTSLSVILAIHWQAARLWLKRIPLVPRQQEAA